MRPIHKVFSGLAAALLLAVALAAALNQEQSALPHAAPQSAQEVARQTEQKAMGSRGIVTTAPRAVPARLPKFACDRRDRPDKGWVLAIYVHPPGKSSRRTDISAIRQTLWETDQTFDASARRFGVSRRVRYVQNANCQPRVADLAFQPGRNRAEMGAEFEKQAARQPATVQKMIKDHRVKQLFFVNDDAITSSCTGIGSDAGLSNGRVILPRWCWGEGGLTHELGHSFGLTHCDDNPVNGNDPMCRSRGTRPECTSDAASNYHLDSCRSDEFRYFEPEPLTRKPALSRNRNVAFSPYLIRNQPSQAVGFQMRVDGTTTCVAPRRGAAVLQPCRAVRQQVWQRQIDRWGYLTLRNLGTERCLQMTARPNAKGAPAVMAKCVPGKRSQQWVPDNGLNFFNRTGGLYGAKLAALAGGKANGTPIVQGEGTTFVIDFAVNKS